jgi:hypothetical protein
VVANAEASGRITLRDFDPAADTLRVNWGTFDPNTGELVDYQPLEDRHDPETDTFTLVIAATPDVVVLEVQGITAAQLQPMRDAVQLNPAP